MSGINTDIYIQPPIASIWVAGLGFSAWIFVYWFTELLKLERYYQSVILLIAISVSSFIIVCAYTNFHQAYATRASKHIYYNYGGRWHFILLFSMFYWLNQCSTGNALENKYDNYRYICMPTVLRFRPESFEFLLTYLPYLSTLSTT